MILALDIGGSSLKWTLQSSPGADLAPQVLPYAQAQPRPSAVLEAVHAQIGAAAPNEIRICVPGPVRDGVLQRSVNLDWTEVDLKALALREFGVETSIVMTDVNAALACARWELGEIAEFLAVILGTGLGVGASIEGQRFKGVLTGHQSVGEGRPCRCGLERCLEGRVGWRGMVALAKKRGLSAENAKELGKLAREGDHDAQRILKETGEILGRACHNWLATLKRPVQLWFAGGPSQDPYLQTGLSRVLEARSLCFSKQGRFAALRGLLAWRP